MRESNRLVSETLAEVAKRIDVGVNGKLLDKIAEEHILDNGGLPGFKGFNGYKYTLCISVNDQIVHGIPSEIEFKSGDIVSVDCGVLKNGFYGDSAFTFALGEVKGEVLNLLKTTRECLYKAIEEAKPGKRIGDIGAVVQKHAEANGYSVVRELVGHGVGRDLHEKPEVPNYGRPGVGTMLKKGLVIAIEPMINMGKPTVKYDKDGWTVKTADKLPSAHFEHTIVIGDERAEALSNFEVIDTVLKNKIK